MGLHEEQDLAIPPSEFGFRIRTEATLLADEELSLCAGCREVKTADRFCRDCVAINAVMEARYRRSTLSEVVAKQPRKDGGIEVYDPDFGSTDVSPFTLLVVAVGLVIGIWYGPYWLAEFGLWLFNR